MDAATTVSAPGAGGQERARHVVLFDFDGVLVRGDAFARFVRRRLLRAWWRLPLLLPYLPLAATRRGRRAAARAAVRLAWAGVDERAYRAQADAFGRALARDARHFSRAAFAALNRHRHAGDRVIVVTGCEHTLARAILDELGLGALELVASRLAKGRLGMRTVLHNVGREKLRQLEAMGVHPPWAAAYSDSLLDLPLLGGAERAVLVNGDSKRVKRAQAELGERVSCIDWR